MRRSIFDILEEEMDLEYEIETIMRLFNETRIYGFNINYSLEDYFDQECIHLWKNRKYVTSSKQMRERLRITDEDAPFSFVFTTRKLYHNKSHTDVPSGYTGGTTCSHRFKRNAHTGRAKFACKTAFLLQQYSEELW